ncbi:hypothetical protein J6590_035445 [Homalodisca vitripennis]|nr:hypothetical protein J6590_035445 [Homalodisca vitripennis]
MSADRAAHKRTVQGRDYEVQYPRSQNIATVTVQQNGTVYTQASVNTEISSSLEENSLRSRSRGSIFVVSK